MMNKKIITQEIDLDGRKLKLETGKLALQADSSVVASMSETVVLATVAVKPILEDPGYFPLSVEYVEKYYAGGRITAQRFIKRESRPSEKAVLAGRAIDRSIRPLFPKNLSLEVQVIITVLSFDGVNDPAFLGMIAASAALALSSVPWAGPIGFCKVGLSDGNLVFDPLLSEVENLNLDLTVAATKEKVVMVEAEGKQVEDKLVFEAIKKGFEQSQTIINLISDFASQAVREKKPIKPLAQDADSKLFVQAKEEIKQRINKALFDKDSTWHEATADMIKEELFIQFADNLTPLQITGLFDKVAKEIMSDTVLNKGKRVDGRAMDEVRPLFIETNVLPRTHGSAIFQRGDTQVLSVATLGPLSAGQTLEGMEGESQKRFMHHYNMSINPFSTGEIKKIAAPNRRDIGHGDLVERSLRGVLPLEADFPYAMRVVSEVLAANASTSMASVCGSTLALLSAGVPIEPVAGVALGLLSNEKNFQVITDMQAVEDFYGEMDFKVAGTKNGVTGIQMDTKLHGISFEIIEEALSQGKKAREMVLEKINHAMPNKAEISKYAPKILVSHIKPEDIGILIGPGGKNINKIIAQTGTEIDIEDDGTVMISSVDENALKQALSAIEGMFKTINVGEEYDGKIVKIAPFGAFVEIMPGKEGLVHVSQMAPGRVTRPEDIVTEGQTVHVRVTNVDSQGKIGLSMLFGNDVKPETESRPRFERSGGYNRGGPSRSGGGRSGFQGGGRRGRFGR